MPRSGRGSPGDEAGPEGGPVEPTEPARAAAPAPAEPEVGGPPSDPVVPDGDPPPHVEHVERVPTEENLRARAAALRERYGPYGMSVTIERPFVLVGDEGPDELRRHAAGTVRWAVERLERDFFDASPRDIVEVWLFGDDRSYRANARAIFDDRPDTPYGYFTPDHQALIMNISTGGGTLVHELVHPYVDNDFPRCPSWLDEGLASLFEQCRDHEGHIWGLTNWRLSGLQDTIDAGALPSFTTLLSTTRHEFYEEDPGSHYAQARYLCYYLQEQGVLPSFYRDFRRDVERDPTGLATLRSYVGDDLEAFQHRWERWVMTLRFG
ncbi:MAG: hypothetical protein H6712_25285 [Myxococcales bacterium]|nr:hypothetical protein [Myxococcales bacterium]